MRPRLFVRSGRVLFLAALSAASAASISACARPSFYDPIYLDTHRWDSREDAAYRRWEAERQLQHVDFQVRRQEEQRDYWRWRHDHPDR